MFHTISNDEVLAAASLSVETVDRFDFRSAEYRDLFSHSHATAFQHPEWIDAFYRMLAPARGARAVIVTGRNHADGRLALVLPLLSRRKSTITLLEAADLGVSDYIAPVLANGTVIDAATREAIAEALPAHDILRIGKVRDEHRTVWQDLLGMTGEPADYGAHVAAHGHDYPAWRATALDAGFVRNLDRKAKRFFKLSGAAVRLVDGADERADAMAAIRRDRAGRFEGDPIQSDAAFAFYSELAAQGGDFVRIYALEAEGERIGHTFCIADGGRLHYLLIGCNYERHGRHSPGYILYDAMMADWSKTGGTEFDFTIGDEPFKADFGTVRTQMFEFVRATGWRGKLARVADEARRHLARARATTGN